MILVAHAWLVQLDRQQTSKPVMVSVVGLIPTRDNFIFAETF